MPDREPYIVKSVTLPKSIAAEIRRIAKDQRRSFSSMLTILLESALVRRAQK